MHERIPEVRIYSLLEIPNVVLHTGDSNPAR